jgi:hypothetical protein
MDLSLPLTNRQQSLDAAIELAAMLLSGRD